MLAGRKLGYQRLLDLGFPPWQIFGIITMTAPVLERIEETIDASLEGWKLRLPEIAARRGQEFGLDAAGVRRYLSTFAYRIGAVEALGEQTFEGLLDEGPEEAL